MSPEEWRPIPGYEGIYEVSDRGRVRSLDRTSSHGRRLRGQILKPVVRSGYLGVGLHASGVSRIHSAHRLVLSAFVGPAPADMEARHLDGDRSNNTASNLAWGTSQQNIRDQLRHGTQANARKTHCPKGHPYMGDNLYVDPAGTRQCRKCKRDNLARWKAQHPDRARAIQRAANARYDAKRRSRKAA